MGGREEEKKRGREGKKRHSKELETQEGAADQRSHMYVFVRMDGEGGWSLAGGWTDGGGLCAVDGR